MTNEKRELFATLGLIAEESVANESVNTELEPEVELTALESIESELNDLEEIEKCQDEAEKASFESMISDLELLNSVLAYKSVKTAGAEEAALESISAEFGISTEGIKELAERGVDALKTLIDKIIALFKRMLGGAKAQEKVLKSLEYKVSVVSEAQKGKYDLKEFARIMGQTMILGAMSQKGYSVTDFPSAGSLQSIIDIANKAAKDYYEDMAIRESIYKPFTGKLIYIEKGIEEVNEKSKSVEDLADFDYHQGAVKLIKAMRMYKIADTLKGAIAEFERVLEKIKKSKKKNQDDADKLIANMSKMDIAECIKTANKFKDLNSANVRALVKLCGQYIKAAKADKPTEEKSA
jgi:hypothetical protein